ncbi:uroporphyrinogen-III synthase [Clostridium minihomine]|uniref:uroporphyrinogen-III synthase n=1 Tax=Clostridium minihomine TaxID=2045012 RepID=UPI001A919AC9|nr:uroporphyrinogen-III synthase [Clostridium minihomine]
MTMDTRGLNGVRLAAIGSATARALEGKGLLADDVPMEYSAARLGEGLAKRVEQGGLVLLARAKIQRPFAQVGLSDLFSAFSQFSVLFLLPDKHLFSGFGLYVLDRLWNET